ncbi:hypothetical protein V6N13_149606 [Hibiscus sabdariffa]
MGREESVRLWRDFVNMKCVVGTCPWAISGDFNVISKSQKSSDFDGSQGFQRHKAPLKQLNSEHFGGISARVLKKRTEVKNLQKLMMFNPTSDVIHRERLASVELRDLMKAEEKFYQQKSRA